MDGLLQIGIFSRLAHTSVRMLRHYGEHGLLSPAWVDPDSGYRYYRAGQLDEAGRITVLRDAGFAVAEMAGVLAAFDDPSALAVHVESQRGKIALERDRLAQRLAAIERLTVLTKEKSVTIGIRTLSLPAMTVAAVRDVIGSYADEGELWQRLAPQVYADSTNVPPGAICGATFHDEEYQDTDVDVEVWQQVDPAFVARPPVVCRPVDAQEVVSATLRGSYDRMPGVTSALGAHVAGRDLTTGTMFNIYRVGPSQDPDPAHWVTDVCLPIVKE
ncbi:MAG: MerR family transcriptional regulator [Propionicimonas sp.]|uniref:MerR family transcriptional regulator n=1 Tax=Propionicimonas sp. TaxID=1955623 RepID=UPI003D134FB9